MTDTKTNPAELHVDKPFHDDLYVEFVISAHTMHGLAGRWDENRYEDGGHEFGMSSDIRIDDNTFGNRSATVTIGGIQAHGYKVAYRRLEGYGIAADIAKVVETLWEDEEATFDEAADAVIEYLKDSTDFDGYSLHDLRRVGL